MGYSQHWTFRGCNCCSDRPLQVAPLSRRALLAGAAATSAAISRPARALAQGLPAAAGADTKPYRIDVHHHLSPPTYVAASNVAKFGDPKMKKWTVEQSLEDMEKGGVATAILSITQPGVSFTSGDAARKLARECNEYAARLKQEHKGRFGSFAIVPLTDIEGSLHEIEYALDKLKAEGIGLLTSYGDKWLGHPMFRPVMEELNRRKAVVYTHPTTANCCVNLQPGIPPGLIEWGTDTTRAIADIVFSGNAVKYPDIRWIFSHAGGTMPFLIERFQQQLIRVPSSRAAVPNGAETELRRFYYDTAQAANPAAMSALTHVVPLSQIVLGSDFPYRSSAEYIDGLRSTKLFREADLKAIERDNALKLLPGIAG